MLCLCQSLPCRRNCYKSGQADILMDRCILCGRCSKACPQHYRVEKTSINSVKNFIKSGETVIASVAPSSLLHLENKVLKSQQYLDILDLHMLKIPVLQQNLFLIYTMHMQMKKIMKTTLHLCVLL